MPYVTGPLPRPLHFDAEASTRTVAENAHSDAPLRIRIAPEFGARALAAALDLARTTGLDVVLVDDDAADDEADVRVRFGAAPTNVPEASGHHPGAAESDERSALSIRGGVADITAPTSDGAFRGLVTFLQLRATNPGVLADLEIGDGPRYAWRGLSLDVARQFFTVDEVKSVIDLLAWHRMSVLHLHLSDSQAWRLESSAYPALTADDDHYSVAELTDLIDYAHARSITIVPELDMPGHTASALRAYPELRTASNDQHLYLAYLDPDVDAAVMFAKTVIGELAALSPSPYLHIGGDEAFGMPEQAFTRFVTEIAEHVRGLGKHVIGWQETARAAALTPDDIAQFWIAEKDAFDADALKAKAKPEYHAMIDLAAETFAHAPGDIGKAVERGVPIIVSSSSPLYLDRKYAEESIDPAQTSDVARVGFPNYEPEEAAGLNTWHPETHVSERLDDARTAGIEAAMWCESVDSFDDLALMLLPRLAIVAERAWNPTDVAWADTAQRLIANAGVWESLGFSNWYRSSALTPVGEAVR